MKKKESLSDRACEPRELLLLLDIKILTRFRIALFSILSSLLTGPYYTGSQWSYFWPLGVKGPHFLAKLSSIRVTSQTLLTAPSFKIVVSKHIKIAMIANFVLT